jgi:hypothetical protein
MGYQQVSSYDIMEVLIVSEVHICKNAASDVVSSAVSFHAG